MARPPRVIVPDGIYHVWTRGSDRRLLFVLDADRRRFLARLEAALRTYQLACIAYCLMGNHYHVVVQTPDERLSRALQELHTGYSREFNQIHERSAHLFRNRFGARLVESDSDLLGVCRYLAYNPVEAGFCEEPVDWPWGSYRASVGVDPPPPFLVESPLRDAVGGGAGWRERYREFVESVEIAPTPSGPFSLSAHSTP